MHRVGPTGDSERHAMSRRRCSAGYILDVYQSIYLNVIVKPALLGCTYLHWLEVTRFVNIFFKISNVVLTVMNVSNWYAYLTFWSYWLKGTVQKS